MQWSLHPIIQNCRMDHTAVANLLVLEHHLLVGLILEFVLTVKLEKWFNHFGA